MTRGTAVGVSLLALAGCSAEQETACGRDCLTAVADAYLAALAANDPAQAPLASDAAFVENLTRMQPGAGLWGTAAGYPNDFRIVVPDAETQSVGLMAIVDQRGEEGVTPVMLAARLQVEDGAITEAEHIVGELQPGADMAALQTPRANLDAAVPESERMTRGELAGIAEAYYDALDESDGSRAPFAADCERQENGLVTAAYYLGPATFEAVDVNGASPPAVARDCIGQMDSARFAYIDSIDNRRVFAVDPERGLAMGLSHFRQSMARGPHEMVAADGSRVMWEEARDAYDLPAAHIFRITDGEIHEVEAVGAFLPYDSPTGWE